MVSRLFTIDSQHSRLVKAHDIQCLSNTTALSERHCMSSQSVISETFRPFVTFNQIAVELIDFHQLNTGYKAAF
jgi:hypothetical protein